MRSWLGVAFLFTVLIGDVATQQPFRSGVDRVRIDVLVADRGRPVTGLTADDFRLFDNGVPQPFDLVSASQPVSVVLLVDLSYTNVSDERIAAIERRIDYVLDAVEGGDQVALMAFGRGARLIADLTSDPAAIRRHVPRLRETARRRSEATALWDAVFWAASVAQTGKGRPVIMALTDGGDNASWLTRRQPSDASWVRTSRDRTVEVLAASGVVVDAILFPVDYRRNAKGDAVYGPILADDIPKRTGGEAFQADARDLKGRIESRLAALRAGYVLAFTPGEAHRDGHWHELRVRLVNRRGSVKARAGYFAPPPL